MAKEMTYLEEKDYKIYSDNEVVRLDYCDNLHRIKKVYKNSKGYYIKGQTYWEVSSIYLRNYEERLKQFKES